QFTVKPGRKGRTADPSGVVAAVGRYATGAPEALAGPVPVETQIDLPRISDAAAEAAAIAANARLDLVIRVNNGREGAGGRTYQLPRAAIAAWTTVKPQSVDGQVELGVDQAQLAADLPGLLTEALTVPTQDERTLVYPGTDRLITTLQWGIDGTRVVDPGPALAEVAAALTEGRDADITAPVEVVPYQELTEEPPQNYGDPDGAKWIDVNKTTYTVTLYEGTTPVNSFYVSIGRGGRYETSDGTFYIYLRFDYQKMRGPPEDPYVTDTNWVSYFNSDIAFHSAPWNEPNGWGKRLSHGCVNMKTADAKTLFDWAPLGTKVEVHY
ncbi:MAG: L,D-transpeptidase, partial [Propionibacteriaceae bacterium]|nr:L,D-transpeptidase [Propionibacteriaceae bacterium]